MARGGARHRPGLAQPFLDADGEEKWLAVRFFTIADAVEQFLCSRDKDIGPIPDREPAEGKPEPLIELERLEFYNWQILPRLAGIYEQPYHFMEELRAAAEGRARYQLTRMNNARGPSPETEGGVAPSFSLQEYFGKPDDAPQ